MNRVRAFLLGCGGWVLVMNVTGCAGPAGPLVQNIDSQVQIVGSPKGAQDYLAGTTTVYAEGTPYVPPVFGWGTLIGTFPLNGPDMWIARFVIPRWSWKFGSSGRSARFVMTNPGLYGIPDAIVVPYDLACAEANTNTRYACREIVEGGTRSSMSFARAPVGVFASEIVEKGLHFHACTSDFVPKGNNRRSYCDRPYAEVTKQSGAKTKVIAKHSGEPFSAVKLSRRRGNRPCSISVYVPNPIIFARGTR